VDVNTATEAELQVVKGIGPATAKSIVAYRQKNGAFTSVDDLVKVKGIGSKSLAKFRADLTVSGGAVRPEPTPVAPSPKAATEKK
jgi:competence protein ComEA